MRLKGKAWKAYKWRVIAGFGYPPESPKSERGKFSSLRIPEMAKAMQMVGKEK